jgi:hypothetical protein
LGVLVDSSWLGSPLGRSIGELVQSLEGLLLFTFVGLWLGALDDSRLGFEDGAEVLRDTDGLTGAALLGVLVDGSWLCSFLGRSVGELLLSLEGCCFSLLLGFGLAPSMIQD